MFQFFVEEEQIHIEGNAADSGGEGAIRGNVTIVGEDVHHIRNVLRMHPGEKIRVSTDGGGYFCVISEINEDAVVAEILEKDEKGTELGKDILLFQGLPKGDKMELIIQKCTELGVTQIIPVAMKHCVVKLDEKKAAAKVNRWQSIAESAAKQSKRSRIPKVHMPVSFDKALSMMRECDVRMLPYENAEGMRATADVLSGITPDHRIAVMIGPEGGFDKEEIDKARECADIISLGRRILRTETAGFTTMALIMYHLEVTEEK